MPRQSATRFQYTVTLPNGDEYATVTLEEARAIEQRGCGPDCSWCGAECFRLFPGQHGEVFCSSAHRITSNKARDRLLRNPPQADMFREGSERLVTREELRQKPEWAEEALRLIDTAYARIGGHANIKTAQDMLADDADRYEFVDIDADTEPDVLQVSKTTPFGFKAVAMGHDGRRESKLAAVVGKLEATRTDDNYAEVSHRLAAKLLEQGVPVVGDRRIVEKVLGKHVSWVGFDPNYPGVYGWYERPIAGVMHRKILVGLPKVVQNPSSTIPIGQCFSWANRYLWEHPDEGAVVCHGTVSEPLAREPHFYEHAWVETADGRVLDWQSMEAGCGGRWRGIGYPIDVFYELYGPENIHRYASEDVDVMVLRLRHHGPWHQTQNPSSTHTPPLAVARAARQGLELRASMTPSRRGGTDVGLRRASQLANQQPVSEDTLRRMRSYFQRHAVDEQAPGWGVDSKGWQAWLLWGGDPGRVWCEKTLRSIE